MKGKDGAYEETLFREQGGPTPNHDQETTQPTSGIRIVNRRHRLPRLNPTVIVTSLVTILVTTSALVALLTYWISR
ncbi:MAG: hypothetical protein SWK90_11290 [Chloroflexota bacterium]|nr:hypothetical protein [Chloroflexota bacterium]